MVNNGLVGGAITILKNMSSSMGRMTSHILWKIKNAPNHQPDKHTRVIGFVGVMDGFTMIDLMGFRIYKQYHYHGLSFDGFSMIELSVIT